MDKKLRVPKTDLKKKPTYELLSLIGKNDSQDITPHPFTKLKPPETMLKTPPTTIAKIIKPKIIPKNSLVFSAS